MKKLKKNQMSGITLIALVVTIIVLLLLAGISVQMLSGDNGILVQAENAKLQTDISGEKEIIGQSTVEAMNKDKFGNLTMTTFKKYLGINSKDGTDVEQDDDNFYVTFKDSQRTYKVDKDGNIEEQISTIPIGLQIGSDVTYEPSGTYCWKAKYASGDLAVTETENDQTIEINDNDVNLSSEENESFRITTWKVLSINKYTNKVELVPTTPKGQVRLQGAQGYNNVVKLLNDACDALYSTTKNGTKIVSARSINLDDFEKRLSPTGKNARDTYNNGRATYNTRLDGAYTACRYYPLIYGLELDSIIDETKTGGTLGPIEQPNFIERIDANLEPIPTRLVAQKSIYPKQTHYELGTTYNNDYKSMFENYGENKDKSYADLLSPRGGFTNYFIASRCLYLNPIECVFYIRCVTRGTLYSTWTYSSRGSSAASPNNLFPVVSLNAEFIKPVENSEGTFKVEC